MKVWRKTCGLRPKNQVVVLTKVDRCVTFCRFGGEKVKWNLQRVEITFQIIEKRDVDAFPIIEASAL